MNPVFNYYEGSIKTPTALGEISLGEFYRAIKNPKPKTIETLKKIREAAAAGDEATKYALKSTLFSFTPCVHIPVGQPRRHTSVDYYTGIMMLDYDKIPPEIAISLKYYLFRAYDFVLAAWLSSSGRGVRVMCRIPVLKDKYEFWSYWDGLRAEMERYQGFDAAPKNSVLPLFISHDPEILIRDTETEFNDPLYPPTANRPTIFKITDASENVHKIMRYRINKIVDQGHPQLRAASYLLGGYVKTGYLSQDYAIWIMMNLIESNAYLSVSTKIDGYKKTALDMIIKGQEKGCTLPEH